MLYDLIQKLIVGAVAVLCLAGTASAAPIYDGQPEGMVDILLPNDDPNYVPFDYREGVVEGYVPGNPYQSISEEENYLWSHAATKECVEAMARGGWTGAHYPECDVHDFEFTPFTKEYGPLSLSNSPTNTFDRRPESGPAPAPEPASNPTPAPQAAPQSEPASEEVSVVDNASATPIAAQNEAAISTSTGGSGLGDVYINYHGNGSPEAGWPTKDKWISFNQMWTNNAALMEGACKNPYMTVPGGKPGNSPHEMEVLRQAILDKAAAGNVDPRVVLAVVLQESNGCVRVHSTGNGVYNPGLMQGHAGQGDCQHIEGQCPDEQIHLMIQDGAIGTASGDGLSRILKGASSAQDVYHAARVYNSGSVAASGDLAEGNGATACYTADVANRLTGWAESVASPRQCP